MKFLTYAELKEMNGATVLFNIGKEILAAKVYIADGHIFLAQNRKQGSDYPRNTSKMRFLWLIDEESCNDYYITNDVDSETLDKFVQMDKDFAHFYNQSEHKVAEFTKTSMEMSVDIINQIFESKAKTADELVKRIQKEAEESMTSEGIDKTFDNNKSASNSLYDNVLEAWAK